MVFVALLSLTTQVSAQNVYFQETFTGGLGSWTTVGLSAGNPVWTYTPRGDAAGGANWGTRTRIASPTGATGAAVFNGDYYDNGGIPNNDGGGPIPAPHISELISPTIDLSGVQGASVDFYQYYRNYACATFVSYSKDDGATWSDPIPLNEDIPVFVQTANGDRKVIPLFSDMGTSTVKIKFTYDGDGYFWILDDIKVVSVRNNLAFGNYIFYTPSSYAQPLSMIQTDTFGFFAEITNNSSVPQSNVRVRAEVLDPLNRVIYKDSVVIGDWMPGERDTADFVNDWAPQGLTLGVHRIRYTILGDSTDYFTNDNTWVRTFNVTNNLFAKENRVTIGYVPGGGPADYVAGAYYKTSTNLVDNYLATNVTFTSAGTLSGKTINLLLLEVDFDLFENDKTVGENPGLILKGFKDFTYGNQTSYTLVSATLDDFDTGNRGVPLKPGQDYFLVAEYTGPANSLFHGFNHIDYNYYFVSTVIYSGNDGRWYTGGFGSDVSAVMRMTIELVTTTDDVPLPESAVTIYPNPVRDVLTVGIDLEEKADVANLTIADVNGKVLLIDELLNVQNDTRTYNMSEYPTGTYLVRLATEKGTRTQKVIVQK